MTSTEDNTIIVGQHNKDPAAVGTFGSKVTGLGLSLDMAGVVGPGSHAHFQRYRLGGDAGDVDMDDEGTPTMTARPVVVGEGEKGWAPWREVSSS